MELKKPVFILSTLISLVTGAVSHTSEEPAGMMGHCGDGICHTFADWVGHGVFGLGWFGFFIGFLVWGALVFGILHQTRKTLAQENSE